MSLRLALGRRLARLFPVFLVLLALFALGCGGGGSAKLEQGVEFSGVTLPRQASPGDTIPIDFSFKTSQPLQGDWWIFIHIESVAGQNCRVVHDRPPSQGPASAWNGQPVTHHVEVVFPPSCKPGRLEVFAGLYSRQTFARLKILEPPTLDNRLPTGWIEIVAENPDKSVHTISPGDMKMRGYLNLLRPWTGWGLGLLATTIACVVLMRILRKRAVKAKESEQEAFPEMLRYLSWILPTIPLIFGILVVLEFIKDDAYISFRYAHNFVHGQGLTFNPGDRLEGFTNFLWTLLLSPFEALGWDLFQVCEVLGTVLSIAMLVQVVTFTGWFNGERKDLSHVWGAVWIATNSSWVLWAKSGLEQPLAALLPLTSCWLLWRGQDLAKDQDKKAEKYAIWSGVLMGLGCMTRPEIHLIGMIVGAPLVLEAILKRKLLRTTLFWFGALLLLTAPFHAFRLLYFKSLFPNTFYVKTGTHGFVWREGLKQLYEMFSFNDLGVIVLMVPFAFMRKGREEGAGTDRLIRKLVMLAISFAFMAYIVKVGVDEMQWFRLYLPAMPFLVILSGLGLMNLADTFSDLISATPSVRTLVGAAGWGIVLYLSSNNFKFTYKEMGGFNGHADLAGTYHPDLGKFITRHERPGGLVAFQDMGSTPYHAPDVDFLDFIGLVDGTVARTRHKYGLHAFISTEGQSNMRLYDEEMRGYFWRRNPEWAILTVYPPRDMEGRIAEAFEKDPGPNAMMGAYSNNSYQFGIWEDPRFHASYVHVRTWQRSRGYYLSLFRRKDLWDQTPGEVVIDAPPPNLGGVKATFENGLELLGSEVTKETLERHEIFVTTWWRVPGPMPKDTLFFIHVNRPGFQAPLDHPPGDWMYPADRWKPGQIIEDRVLFQLPITMKPNLDYDVHIGVYRKSTGERLKVVGGTSSPDGRLNLGSFHVKRLYPLIHQLIPPTVPSVMRKYPDRILKGR